MRALRIGIDGRAFSSPAAGVRRYVAGLVPALLAGANPPQIVALGGDPATFPSGVGIEHVAEPWHPPTNPGWVIVGLPRAARLARVDVLHAPAYTAPLVSPVPVVLTIHDVSYERHPEWYPYRRDSVRRAFYRRSARAAAHVLTDSEFSRGEIVAAYHLSPGRITVAPLGVSADFAPPVSVAPTLPAAVTAPFLLHVGDLHARRNLGIVVGALAEVRHRLAEGESPTLVLAGVDRGSGDALSALAASRGIRHAVVQLGAVGEPTLRSLYASALALVYPSRYEGFGLPVLEAMASGTPVLAARAASMPEVLGDAGMLLDPDEPGGWIDAIMQVTQQPTLRAEMREAGLARARTFTWTRTAAITLNTYRTVVEEHTGARD